MYARWITIAMLAALLWKLPAERRVVVVDRPAPHDAANDNAASPRVHLVRANRALVRETLADPSPLFRGGRLVPLIIDGARAGFKLYAIRSGSLYEALGFENGDSLRRINGVDLGRVAPGNIDALASVDLAEAADELVIDVTRRGEPLQVRILIRD